MLDERGGLVGGRGGQTGLEDINQVGWFFVDDINQVGWFYLRYQPGWLGFFVEDINQVGWFF